MELLYYNELDYKKVAKQFNRVTGYLSQSNFAAAEVKKMPDSGFYRAKLDYENRLLFRFARHNNKNYILLLEVIYNHEYHKSRFLRGSKIDEAKCIEVPAPELVQEADSLPLSYVNPAVGKFHLLDKVISFDDIQETVFNLQPPLIIIGSAGSGKTALTLEKLKSLGGNILYITLSRFLVDNSYNLYYSNNYENENQEIDFLSYNDFCSTLRIMHGKEMDQRAFELWTQTRLHTFGIKDSHKLFEEFRGVLTGMDVDKPYLSRQEYLGLGVRRSIFLGSERDKVYDAFEKYLEFVEASNFFDVNILSHHYLQFCEPRYDFIVVDEVQDFTNIQLFLVLKSLKEKGSFILCGDSNQIVHPNFFSWTNVKGMFYKHEMATQDVKILRTNYRNSPEITALANRLLKIKNARFGSIDKESTYLIEATGNERGEALLLHDNEKVRKMLNEKTSRSAKFAVLVMRKEDKPNARKLFKTPLLFSIHESKGLEYENVIILNFINDNAREFNEIAGQITESELDAGDITFARSRDKTDKSIDAYKFYINSLYVAITRSIKNVYLVESNHKHRLLHLLKLTEAKDDVKISGNVSSAEEWRREAEKLEKQGKKEYADEIRKIFFAQQSPDWEPITNANLDTIKKEALNPEHFNKKAKDKLFAYALIYDDMESIRSLIELKYRRANDFAAERTSIYRKYYADYKSDNVREITAKIQKYGLNYRDQFNLTPLLAAVHAGSLKCINYLMTNGADVTAMDNLGRNVLRTIIRQKYLKTTNEQILNQVFSNLKADALRLNVDDKLLLIPDKKFEYFLVNLFLSVQKLECAYDEENRKYRWGFKAKTIEEAIADYPETIIPEYRKKRSYISSILAKNEVFGSNPYNSKLFFRINRGEYLLNATLALQVNEKWVNVYELMNAVKPEILTEDEKIERFRENIARDYEKYPHLRPYLEEFMKHYRKQKEASEPAEPPSMPLQNTGEVTQPSKNSEIPKSKQKAENDKDPAQMELPF